MAGTLRSLLSISAESASAVSLSRVQERGRPVGRPLQCFELSPASAVAAAASAAVTAFAARLRRRTRRGVLRPLDELLGRDELAVLVLRDELEADAAPCLVDFLHDHVDDVAT